MAGTYQNNRKIIQILTPRKRSTWSRMIGSRKGSSTLYPSKGGRGIKLKKTADTCRARRNESPGQMPELLVCEKRRTRPRMIATRRFDIGPASDMALSQNRLRIRQRSIYTAPPGKPIPPMTRKSNGKIKENNGCVYLSGL